MNTPSLLPCPFCGSAKAPEILDEEEMMQRDEAAPETTQRVVCCNVLKEGCGASSGWHDSPKLAAEAWNQRER